MRHNLTDVYLPSCSECLCNKSSTSLPPRPLHPLLVLDSCGDSVTIDFIGPLPRDDGYNTILTITDQLNADICLIPCNNTLSVQDLAGLFFEHWYCKNGLPLEIISD